MGKWENGKMGKWENGKMGTSELVCTSLLVVQILHTDTKLTTAHSSLYPTKKRPFCSFILKLLI